jgi:hypothetical protein
LQRRARIFFFLDSKKNGGQDFWQKKRKLSISQLRGIFSDFFHEGWSGEFFVVWI